MSLLEETDNHSVVSTILFYLCIVCDIHVCMHICVHVCVHRKVCLCAGMCVSVYVLKVYIGLKLTFLSCSLLFYLGNISSEPMIHQH